MPPVQVKRKLTAILSADVKGYSPLMGEDEEETIRALKGHLKVISRLIAHHQGRVVGTGGDSVLAEFTSVVDAVRCAVAIQRELAEKNTEFTADRRLEFRIGINLGDVVEEEETILGDGVNIAARLEGLAEAGGICISGTAFDQVRNKLELGSEYLGEQTVKNIALPVRAYKVLMAPEAVGKVIEKEKPKPKSRGWKAIVGLVVIVLASLGLIWDFYWLTPPMAVARVEKMAFPLPDKPSIAVLPFVNLNNDPKEDYISDGLTEQIITSLSSFGRLFVIARNSTFVYKGKPVKVQQVAEDLGVRYVLERSVQKSGDRLRITAQLIDALTGDHLWAEQYNRGLKDIFAVQDEITSNILTAMHVKLTEGEQARRIKPPRNLEAYLKTLQAQASMQRYSKEGNTLGRQLAEEAIALDPGDSRPHANLGFLSLFRRDYGKALAEGDRAVALDPRGADAYAWLGVILNYSDKPREAIPMFEKAIRLNPNGPPFYFHNLGLTYRFIGQYPEAVTQYQKALRISPDNIFANLGLTATYILMGQDQEGRAQAKELLRINPQFSLETYARSTSHKNQAKLDQYIDALRRAGLE
jgi:adenylate cyclase